MGSPANRVFPGPITKALLPESDVKRLEGVFKPLDDYDHLARWECMMFGRQIQNRAVLVVRSFRKQLPGTGGSCVSLNFLQPGGHNITNLRRVDLSGKFTGDRNRRCGVRNAAAFTD
jgi:hypothetical protein